jgi:hypothetical protein
VHGGGIDAAIILARRRSHGCGVYTTPTMAKSPPARTMPRYP